MSVVICFPHIYSTVIIVPAGINRNCVGRIEEVVPEHQPPKLNVCTLLSNPSLRRILGFFSRFYFTSIVYMHTQIRTHICIYILCIVSWDFSGLVCVCQLPWLFFSYPTIDCILCTFIDHLYGDIFEQRDVTMLGYTKNQTPVPSIAYISCLKDSKICIITWS